MTIIRSYRELRKLKTFEERYRYLKLKGVVGESTFGFDRYLNQLLYGTQRWKDTRDKVIIRDEACDLGMEGYDIKDFILIHHMNPITVEDIELGRDIVYDPEFLICTSKRTHNAIHFGDESLLPKLPIERKRNDTCPWR
jgi:hypothetical protein